MGSPLRILEGAYLGDILDQPRALRETLARLAVTRLLLGDDVFRLVFAGSKRTLALGRPCRSWRGRSSSCCRP